MPLRLTSADYHTLAHSFGLTWSADDLPLRSYHPTRWTCPAGHTWKRSYAQLKLRPECPDCRPGRRKLAEDYHALAEKRGLTWIGETVPPNTRDKTLWRCAQGHLLKKSYGKIYILGVCRECSPKRPRTAEDYHQLANSIGYRWIGSDLPKNTKKKTVWLCSNHHRWETSYQLLHHGLRCRYCLKAHPKQVADYHALAASVGLRWTGGELPESSKKETEWICGRGHVLRYSYHQVSASIRRKRPACRVCKKEDLYQQVAQARGIRWVGGRLPAGDYAKTEWECSQGHHFFTTYGNLNHGSGCPLCKRRGLKHVGMYRQLAADNGLRWISEVTPLTKERTTEWECGQGHRFRTSYSRLAAHPNCPLCKRAGQARLRQQNAVDRAARNDAVPLPEAYQDLASSLGLIWADANPPPSKRRKTLWRCRQGHSFYASFAQLRAGKCACQDCVAATEPQAIGAA